MCLQHCELILSSNAGKNPKSLEWLDSDDVAIKEASEAVTRRDQTCAYLSQYPHSLAMSELIYGLQRHDMALKKQEVDEARVRSSARRNFPLNRWRRNLNFTDVDEETLVSIKMTQKYHPPAAAIALFGSQRHIMTDADDISTTYDIVLGRNKNMQTEPHVSTRWNEMCTTQYLLWNTLFNKLPFAHTRVPQPRDSETLPEGYLWIPVAAVHSANDIGLSEDLHMPLIESLQGLGEARWRDDQELRVLILHNGIDAFTTNNATWQSLTDDFPENVKFCVTTLVPPIFASYYPSIFTLRGPGTWTHHKAEDLRNAWQPDPSAAAQVPPLFSDPKSTRWCHFLQEGYKFRKSIQNRWSRREQTTTLLQLRLTVRRNRFLCGLDLSSLVSEEDDDEMDLDGLRHEKHCETCSTTTIPATEYWERGATSPGAVRCSTCEIPEDVGISHVTSKYAVPSSDEEDFEITPASKKYAKRDVRAIRGWNKYAMPSSDEES